MRIVVCVKRTAGGELNPFDACAYEAALQIPGSEVILLSMGPDKTEEMLLNLTRLGAKEAYLLCDSAFAGADTLATAYALGLAVKKLSPDLVICGRQTVDGDTAQTGPSLSMAAGLSLITNVMEIKETAGRLVCETRDLGEQRAEYPALITVERINHLRLPSIRSKKGTVTRWTAEDIGADRSRCGLKGSPTRVLASFQNEEGKRKCKFVEASVLPDIIREGLERESLRLKPAGNTDKKLKKVWIVGEAPRSFAESVSEDITVIRRADFCPGNIEQAGFVQETCGQADIAHAGFAQATCGQADNKQENFEPGNWNGVNTSKAVSSRSFAQKFAEYTKEKQPEVILWGSDAWSKAVAPQVAALLQTGLCADCTALETDGETLFMYRPAFSGNIMAKIMCRTKPQMATVRTLEEGSADVVCALGKGAKNVITEVEQLIQRKHNGVEKYCSGGKDAFENVGEMTEHEEGKKLQKARWDLAASRGAVDAEMLPYDRQVGITGKSVNPAVYLAIGISGAVHHIAGMKQSGLVIAVNPDRKAPIFEYADYGIVANAEEIIKYL